MHHRDLARKACFAARQYIEVRAVREVARGERDRVIALSEHTRELALDH